LHIHAQLFLILSLFEIVIIHARSNDSARKSSDRCARSPCLHALREDLALPAAKAVSDGTPHELLPRHQRHDSIVWVFPRIPQRTMRKFPPGPR
jgi:hypothetical protein